MNSIFPALDHATYLNTPTQGLISTALVNYRKKLIDSQLHQASVFTGQSTVFMHEVRKTVAGYLDAAVPLTALVPNFSLAFNNLLCGIDSKAHFLLLKGDYPSINTQIEARGFRCSYAAVDAQLEQNIARVVDQERPDFLCLSIVQYINGIQIDLEFLKRLKQEYPDLIIVADATQYIGVEGFRFRESGIDIIGASCYKWMHAGNGNAFLCFKEEVVNRVKPDFTTYTPGQEFTNQRGSFMGYLEPGHQDMIAYGSLKKAIELIQEYGQERISNEINEISQKAKTAFAARNLLEQSVVARDHHSSIFNLKGDDDLFHLLQEHHIHCAQRGAGIRVGFSYFNTDQDLEKLLNVIDLIPHDGP